MKNSYVRIAVTTLILVLLILVATYMFTTEFSVAGFSTKTISGFKDTLDQYSNSETVYKNAVANQKAKIEELKRVQTSYDDAKRKYENLTPETINIVKEANKTEKYSIEYLWIRLGDYAKKHNVQIMIVDPESTVVNTASGSASGNVTTDGNGAVVSASQDANGSTSMAPQTNILKVQVVGSYINIADYIYVIENDSTLRFRLDNIKMESAGDGNKVRVSFGVKNLQIVK